MKVIWMPLAKEALRQTSKYISKEFGKTAQSKFMQEVKKANSQIGNNPGIGQIEPLLDKMPTVSAPWWSHTSIRLFIESSEKMLRFWIFGIVAVIPMCWHRT